MVRLTIFTEPSPLENEIYEQLDGPFREDLEVALREALASSMPGYRLSRIEVPPWKR